MNAESIRAKKDMDKTSCRWAKRKPIADLDTIGA